jgi:WD repeat and FYVE domain-containing protein 3
VFNNLTCCNAKFTALFFKFQVGGFVYVTSVFVSLDGKLSDNSDITKTYLEQLTANESNIEQLMEYNQSNIPKMKDLLQLLHIVCHTLATAMRFEPANAKFFHQEVCFMSL